MGRDTLPGFEPGALPPSTRYQRFAHDAGQGRRDVIKSLMLLIGGVGIVAAWKAGAADSNGAQEALNFLIRYAITLVTILALFIACCAIKVTEFSGQLSFAALAIAGALAASLLAQHIGAETFILFGVPLLGVPWLLGLLVFIGLASDLLDLDITEAALYSIFVLGARLILKFALFDHMFG